MPAPPAQAEETARNILVSLLPMSSILIMGVFYAFIYSSGGRSGSALFALPMIVMGLVSVIASLIMYGEQKHQQKVVRIKQMRAYHQLLDRKEGRLFSSRLVQLDILEDQYPGVRDINRRVLDMDLRLWERRLQDADFLTIRIGTGKVPAFVQIKSPDPDNPEPDIRRAYGIYTEYKDLPEAPVTVALHSVDSLAIVGERKYTLPYMRNLLSQVAAVVSPEDALIFLFSSAPNYKQWEWLRWLPHTSQRTGMLSHSMAFTREDRKNLFGLLTGFLDNRIPAGEEAQAEPREQDSAGFLLSVFDGETDLISEPGFPVLVNQGSQLRSVAIFICNTLEDVPSDCKAVIQILDPRNLEYWQVGPQGKKWNAVPEYLSLIRADNFAHQLLSVATVSQGLANRIPRKISLLQTYELKRLEQFHIRERWMRMPPDDGLLPFPVLIGNESQVTPLVLHLAEQHDGPHGLVAGTTGSGKSELLQTLVVSLALEHHPYFVSFLLIDFKGGSAFGVFNDMPHTVGNISNLDKATALRALEAIKAELHRRQEFLIEVKAKDVNDYHRNLARLGELPANWKPLPHLFIIVDEFAELAKEMPSFLPELMSTLRLGRALGMHLVLATQRPAGAVNDEMRSNLNFRISLRVQTIEDSRDVLKKSDAAMLPKDLPGRAYFQVGDSGVAHQFQSSYVGGEYTEEAVDEPAVFYKVQDEQITPIIHVEEVSAKTASKEKKPSLVKLLVENIKTNYAEMKTRAKFYDLPMILLPPLPEKMSLRESIQELLEIQPWWKCDQEVFPQNFTVLLGKIDNLANTSQPPLEMEFPGKRGGHLIVLGAPGSGKTSFLRSFVASVAYRYSPAQAHFYVLSFAGRGLDGLIRLPHVGDVVHGNEPERISRLLRFLRSVIEERKVRFGGLQVDNLAHYNSHARVSVDQRLPAIFVLIDNFGELRDQVFLDELEEIQRLIENGRNYGVYFVLTALQLSGIPYKTLNLIDQRIALNLTDRTDYSLFIGRLASLEFDVLPPGRGFLYGLTPQSIHLADVGDISENADGSTDPNKPGSFFGELVAGCRRWSSVRPPIIGVLPEWVNLSSLHAQQSDACGCLLGVDSDSLQALPVKWVPGMHWLIGGPPQSGRTSALHTIALSIIHQYSPEQAWLVLVDGAQGSLRSLFEFPHVLNWVIDEESLKEPLTNLEAELTLRRKLASQGKLGNPPKIFLIIDDYDLTRDAIAIHQDVLTQLAQFMRRDSDLGIHMILSGISQKLAHENDPVLRQMKLLRTGLSLVDAETMDALGGRPTSAMRKQELPVGRGYFLKSGKLASIVQMAFPDAEVYEALRQKYQGVARACWPNPATTEEIEKKVIQKPPAVSDESIDDFLGGKSLDDWASTYLMLKKKQSGQG